MNPEQRPQPADETAPPPEEVKPSWRMSRGALLAILAVAILLVGVERVYLRGVITRTVAWEVYIWLVTLGGLGLGAWRLWVERRK